MNGKPRLAKGSHARQTICRHTVAYCDATNLEGANLPCRGEMSSGQEDSGSRSSEDRL